MASAVLRRDSNGGAACGRWSTNRGSVLGEVEPADVARERQNRDALLGDRGVDRLLDHSRHLVDGRDRLVEHGDVSEDGVVVDLLEEVAADVLARHLAADGQHRRL
jgi:hypothetical protein